MAIPQCQDKWITTGDRVWMASILPGPQVIVRHILVQSNGADDYPETWELTWQEWVDSHETTYGLDINGIQVAAIAERRAAWRKLNRMASGEAAYTEENMRGVIGAFRRILRDLTPEVEE